LYSSLGEYNQLLLLLLLLRLMGQNRHLIVGAVVFVFLFLLWGKTDGDQVLFLDALMAGWTDLLSMTMPVLYSFYGAKLIQLLRTAVVQSGGLRVFASKILAVTAVCSSLWLFRAAVSIWSITQEYNGIGTGV
jgi:hypothetical protein